MTNLISSGRRPWVTRGRVLVGLPISLGLLISVPVLFVALLPAWQDVQELERRRDSLLVLLRNLPVLVKQLETESTALAEAQQQQALLLGLLAGRDKVQTFLALLNQQALFSGVAIQRYEPINTPPPSSRSPKSPSGSTSETGDAASEPPDPLLAAGYQKTSVGLAVRGPYAGLQKFLQRMEALELLVESSDLEIKVGVQGNDNEAATSPVASRTQLTVQLSFYDPQPEGDVVSDNSKENAPS